MINDGCTFHSLPCCASGSRSCTPNTVRDPRASFFQTCFNSSENLLLSLSFIVFFSLVRNFMAAGFLWAFEENLTSSRCRESKGKLWNIHHTLWWVSPRCLDAWLTAAVGDVGWKKKKVCIEPTLNITPSFNCQVHPMRPWSLLSATPKGLLGQPESTSMAKGCWSKKSC